MRLRVVLVKRLRRLRLRLDPALVLALLLCLGLYVFVRRDISPMNYYLGDDGRDYVNFVQRFDELLADKGVSRYTMTRVGAIWFVRKILLLFGVALEAPEIVHKWQAINAVALAVALAAFLATLRRMHVSLAGRTLGVALAFGAYGIAKWPYFYPNMIDTLALTLGALFAYFHVRRSTIGLLATLVASVFTWPYLLGIAGLLLLAFAPRRPLLFSPGEAPGRDEPTPRAGWIAWTASAVTAAALATLVTAAVMLHAKERLGGVPDAEQGDPFERYRHYDPLYAKELLPITITVLLVTGVVPVFALLRGMRARDVLAELRVGWALVAGVVIVVAQRLQASWANIRSWTEPPVEKLVIQFALTINRPAQALVGQLAFFGVATVLLILFFRDFAAVARRMGAGYIALLAMCFLLLLTSEARQEGPVFFLVLPVLVKAIDQRGVRWPLLAFASVAGASTSEVWLDIRRFDTSKWTTPGYGFLELPQQWYFLHHAISMNHLAFAAHAVAFVLILAAGLVVVRRWTPA